MAILNINPYFTGEVGVFPRIVRIETTDTYDDIVAENYLQSAVQMGFEFYPNDYLLISYGSESQTTKTFTVTKTSSSITLDPTGGDIVTPVVAGEFAMFANTEGALEALGKVPSDADKTVVVMSDAATTVGAIATYTDIAGTVGQNPSTAHAILNTTGAGKTIRLNSRTESTDTTSSLIGFQSKIGRGISAATDVIGAEISPRLNDAIALTGSGSVIGFHVDTYLKGTTGDIAGDVRGMQVEMVDDTSSTRTIAGNVTHLRVRSNISYTVSGKYSAFRVEAEEGTKKMDALVQFTTGSGCLVETSGTVGGTQDQAIKILIGTTTYYVPLYTTVS